MRIERPVGAADVREAIVRAATGRGWMVKAEKDGCVTLLLEVRAGKHTVVVDVVYTGEEFAVNYVSSTNMGYAPQTGAIRSKYAQWVRNLKKDIRIELSKIR